MGPFRDGHVHVLTARCETCIFRPGNLMHLAPGRVEGMVAEAVREEAAITCHSTLYRDDVAPAVCAGFASRYSTLPLRLAELTGILVNDPVPGKAHDALAEGRADRGPS
jgi:hypothetical protein